VGGRSRSRKVGLRSTAERISLGWLEDDGAPNLAISDRIRSRRAVGASARVLTKTSTVGWDTGPDSARRDDASRHARVPTPDAFA
jgi:hypothetical protein